jgi:hypothetical protein
LPDFCITRSEAGGGLPTRFTRTEDRLPTPKHAARLTASLRGFLPYNPFASEKRSPWDIYALTFLFKNPNLPLLIQYIFNKIGKSRMMKDYKDTIFFLTHDRFLKKNII